MSRCRRCKEGTVQVGDIELQESAAGEWKGRVVRFVAPNRWYESCHTYDRTWGHESREAALTAARDLRDKADWSKWRRVRG